MNKLNILISGRNKKSVSFVNDLIKKYPNLKRSNKPEVILSLGGDGTYFFNEIKYPGVPKILVRDKSICKLCSIYNITNIKQILKELNERNFKILESIKLECNFKNRKLTGVNDIIIRNKNQYEAIRFSLRINNKESDTNLIGDGIIVSTVFGSTGYFNSITKAGFTKGIGLAFNNVSEKEYLILDENEEIEFVLLRGQATVSADNNKKLINLIKDDIIKIRKSKEKAYTVIIC